MDPKKPEVSAQEAASLLRISASDVLNLEKQELLRPIRQEVEGHYYARADIDRIRSAKGETVAQAANQVGIEIQRDLAASLAVLRKIVSIGVVGFLGYAVLVMILAGAFILFPAQTTAALGYTAKTTALSFANGEVGGSVLGATTGLPTPKKATPTQAALQQVGKASLGIVKYVSPDVYTQVSQSTILDPNDVLSVDQNGATPILPLVIPNSTALNVQSAELVNNLNSQYVQGRKPGTNAGDIAVFGENGQILGLTTTPGSPTVAPVAAGTSTTVTRPGNTTIVNPVTSAVGLTNANLSGNAGITNSNLANPYINFVAGSGISISSTQVGLGGSLTITDNGSSAGVSSITGTTDQVNTSASTGAITLSLPQGISSSSAPTFTALTLSNTSNQISFGSGNIGTLTWGLSSNKTITLPDATDTLIGKATTDTLSNKSIDGSNNTITGLTASSLTSGDFSSKINSGTYTINISGSAAKINSNPLGDTNPASGRILVADGLSWISQALSGDATLSSIGALTLKNVGSPGVFGSAISIPTLTIDLQGRVSAITTHVIAGLTTSNFTSGDVSQWANDIGYINATDAATLTNKVIDASQNSIIGLTNSELSGHAGISNANLANSAINLAGDTGTSSASLGSTLTFAGLNGISSSVSGSLVSFSLNANGTFSTLTTSGETDLATSSGNVNLGSASGSAAINIMAGTGNVNFTVGSTGTSGQVQIGNSGTATPDLLVLDNGTADPTGVNGGMYYNTSSNRFRCYENGAWTNCVGATSNTFTDNTLTGLNPISFTSATEAWNDSTRPNITITRPNSHILVNVVISGTADDANDQNPVFTIRRAVGVDPTCSSTQVDGEFVGGFLTANTQVWGATASVVDTASSSVGDNVRYTVCTTTDGLDDANLSSVSVSVIELGADLAEKYYTSDASIAEGDVVAIDSSLPAGVKKTQSAYDPQTLGVVSTAPGMVLDDAAGIKYGRPVPIALSGRVPVKVSAENGRVKAGDHLTASSKPGIAMKATKAGPVIGQALEDDNFRSDQGLVMTFVKTGFFNGINTFDTTTVTGPDSGRYLLSQIINGSMSPQTAAAPSEIITDRVIAGLEIVAPKITTGELVATKIRVGQIEGLRDFVLGVTNNATGSAATPAPAANPAVQILASIFNTVAEFFDRVIFHSDVAFLGHTTFSRDSAGHALIVAGQTEVAVNFEHDYDNTPVVTIGTNLISGLIADQVPNYAVYDSNPHGFIIRLARPATSNLIFSWIALGTNSGVNVNTTLPPNASPTTVVPNLGSATPIPVPIALPTPSPVPTPDTSPSVAGTSSSSLTTIPTPTPSSTPTISTSPSPLPSPTPAQNASPSASTP